MSVLHRRVAWCAATIGMLAGAGCADDGQIELTNITEADVDVRLDGKAVEEVSGSGGTVILSGECYDGPIVVTYADKRRVEVQGPICGGQELLIGDKTVKLRASSTN